MDELIDAEMINRFFDDGGNKIDPHTMPVTGLCFVGKLFQLDDRDKNLLCRMNRYDQRNEQGLRCGTFKKM